jgi:hypothetical protein
MPKLERSFVTVVTRRFRSRAVVELENLAPRHQLHVLRRKRPGRSSFHINASIRIFSSDSRLRQEILAMDGATLLGPNGSILAVEAILKIRAYFSFENCQPAN